MRVPQADEAAADPVVVKPVDSVTTVDAAVATAASASAQAEPAGQAGDVSAAGAAQPDTAGAGAGTLGEAATRTADVITPGSAVESARVEAMPVDAVVALQAAAALPDPQMAGLADATSATALDEPAEGTSDAAMTALAAAGAVPAGQVADAALIVDSGLGTASTQSVVQPVAADSSAVVADQPLFAGTDAGAGHAKQAVSEPAMTAAAAAAASDPADGEAAFVQQPGMFGAQQQRRQVVARLPGRRRGHAPLSDAQQRLQRQWQARHSFHCMSHGCTGNRMSSGPAYNAHVSAMGAALPCVALHAEGNAGLQVEHAK